MMTDLRQGWQLRDTQDAFEMLNLVRVGLPCIMDKVSRRCAGAPGSWWATATASAAPCGAGTWRSRGSRPAAMLPPGRRAGRAATTPRPRSPAPGRRRRSGTSPAQSSLEAKEAPVLSTGADTLAQRPRNKTHRWQISITVIRLRCRLICGDRHDDVRCQT